MAKRPLATAAPTVSIELEDLSWAQALDRLGGSTELLARLSRDFITQFRDAGALVRSLIGQGDHSEAASRLHKLRGVAATLGADDLAREAGTLLAKLRDEHANGDLEPELRRFSHSLGSSIDAMACLVEKLEEGSLQPSSTGTAAEHPPRDSKAERRVPAAVRKAHRLQASRGDGSTSPGFHRHGLPKLPRLLVVDDEPTIRQSLMQIFQADYEVAVASSGPQALASCRRHKPDLILLDIVMPEMDGIETLHLLQNEPGLREVPVIFVTSENRPGQEVKALEYGAVDFITKPLNPAVVRARVGTHLTLKQQSDMLRSLVFVDGLTGIGNRRLFDERLDLEWRSCRRSGAELSLLMIDVDQFKLYNDCLGHQQGDACLREVADILSEELRRPRDFLARYGGEEFACLLPETLRYGAAAKARSLVEAVEARGIPHPDSDCGAHVTISIGVASCRPGPEASAGQLLADADEQLYLAKTAGRNRVSVATPVAVRKLSLALSA